MFASVKIKFGDDEDEKKSKDIIHPFGLSAGRALTVALIYDGVTSLLTNPLFIVLPIWAVAKPTASLLKLMEYLKYFFIACKLTLAPLVISFVAHSLFSMTSGYFTQNAAIAPTALVGFANLVASYFLLIFLISVFLAFLVFAILADFYTSRVYRQNSKLLRAKPDDSENFSSTGLRNFQIF